MILNVYGIVSDFHAFLSYMLVHKNIRDANNLYKRPDFTQEHIYPEFITNRNILKYLSITSTLPHGESIGIDSLLTSPETYLGERETDVTMDVIFMKRDGLKK